MQAPAANLLAESGLHSALRTTQIEIAALEAFAEALRAPPLRTGFLDAVAMIADLSGRLIVTGMSR